MYKHLVVVVALSSLCCFLYGIVNLLLYVEKNECQMTYMYQMPTFVRVPVEDEKSFPKYNLFIYAEGSLIENARSYKLNGAPVIFIPGNSGSHKQGRSLASVALRKGLEHSENHHLDFYLVDYNEEYSALFGGYFDNQKEFLKKCIKSVLKLYRHLKNPPKQVILIGHSMGGKVAQAMLLDDEVSEMVNTIVFLATPIDRPVVNFDVHMEAAYRKINTYLGANRKVLPLNNETNYCRNPNYKKEPEKIKKKLDDKLLISIGGGDRDLLVHTGLTYSKYCDINVMTYAMPNVWLSTDHLASVWCRQVVLVINRFLFSIISHYDAYGKHGLSFLEDKVDRLLKAQNYFLRYPPTYQESNPKLILDQNDEWVPDNRRVFTKNFENGTKNLYLQMIPLYHPDQYSRLYADVTNLESDDWILGCDTTQHLNRRWKCPYGQSISHRVRKIPYTLGKLKFVEINLHTLKAAYPKWNIVILRIAPTKNNIKLNVDIHDPAERTLSIKAPKWYSYTKNKLITDTTLGATRYTIEISDLEESHQAIKFNIKPYVCSKPTHKAIIKTCVPWAEGYERYHVISHLENNSILVTVPFSKPSGYNMSKDPVTMTLHLDSSCRYQISYQNSFEGTLSRIALQYGHWLPAHLTAVILLSFKYQLSLTPNRAPFKCGKVHSAIVHSGSFFIITITKIISKILQSVKFLPDPDNFHHSLLISVIIHGSSSALLLLTAAGLWAVITFCGSMIHGIFLRLTKLSTPVFSIALPIVDRFPILAGVALISIAVGSCGGVALILGCLVYLMLIAKQYEDYLEKFVYDTFVTITKKLFGKNVPTTDNESTVNNEVQDQDNDESTVNKEEQDQNNELTENKKEQDQSNSNESDNIEKPLMITEKGDTKNSNVQTEESDEAEDSDDSEIEDIKERNAQDEELEQLLNEAIEKQKILLKEKQDKRKLEQMEYDSIHEGLNSVNFHLTLFLLMLVLVILFIPTTISWAKDFRYSKTLSPDPSLFPATIVLACVFGLWQISAPRNLYAYNFVASILYVCAAICVVYCQDSVYRLSAVIPTVFVLVTLHQIFSSTKTEVSDFDPEEQEVKNRIEKMKAVLDDANSKKEK